MGVECTTLLYLGISRKSPLDTHWMSWYMVDQLVVVPDLDCSLDPASRLGANACNKGLT